MARSIFSWSCLLLCWSLLVPVLAQDETFTALAEDHQLAGMSVVTRCQGETVTSAHVGFRDIGRKLPANAQTLYRMASISKAVVALMVADLVEGGAMDYDAPLSSYLDSPPVHPGHPDVPLTVNHLLTHTSGIRDGSGYGPFLSASYADIPNVPQLGDVLSEDGEHYTTDMWGNGAPGTWFQYANLNYGVLATVMEAATGIRFDLLAHDLLFGPFGLDAGFRVQQLDDINDVAVLYRQYDGQWTPQADHYLGEMPAGPDWSGYIPGTNAACFSPQGGLRISAEDLSTLVQLWSTGIAEAADGADLTLLGPDAVSALKAQQWSHDPSGSGNGNNYYGLFNAWARGLHLAASGLGEDEVIPEAGVSPFIGHPGEAYGLISDAYSTPAGEWSVVLAINGKWDGYGSGPASAYYAVEQEVFAALQGELQQCLTASVEAPHTVALNIAVLGMPRAGDTTLTLRAPGLDRTPHPFRLLDETGRDIAQGHAEPTASGNWRLTVPPLRPGWHIGQIGGGSEPGRFLLVVGG